MNNSNYTHQFPPPFEGEFDFEDIAQVSSALCYLQKWLTMFEVCKHNGQELQDMHHILGGVNPVADDLLPPQQIQLRLHHHVPPELEANDPHHPTLESPIK